ncbi:pyridoxamine 5'-phosphate oxidase family protein [Blastomonas sp. SL216]|uniref:pyridoxamine 5'-phosphate oxidase family protein n=1 Tax=Blastomonas sp. SL216 TaxID=2995169 RepID=UPI0023770D56|nr:pyridoxamine 5'-phosphate oxidase family protein [Blastomonas sp. SL216]
MPASSDIAFTPTIKAIQSVRGSRDAYARMEDRGGFRTQVDETLAEFLTGVDTAFLATTNAAGQPYAQHRGGPPGFIRVLGSARIGWADYTGNRQYISTGNLADNDKAFLILMDYARPRRIKIWGRATTSDDPAMIAQLMPPAYRAKGEQAVVLDIAAWDVNCPQHIPQKINASDVSAALARLETRIAELEAENTVLKRQKGAKP